MGGMFKLRQLLIDGSGPDISFFQEVSRKASAHPMGLTKQNCPTCPLVPPRTPTLSTKTLLVEFERLPGSHPRSIKALWLFIGRPGVIFSRSLSCWAKAIKEKALKNHRPKRLR